MACSCQKNRKKYEVVSGGKVVYSSSSKPTADSVSKRYPGSEVREAKPAAATK